MKPGVEHYVVTLQDSIVRGGHFYAYETLVETFHSKVEEAFCGQTITNTEHLDSDALLFRLVERAHSQLSKGIHLADNRKVNFPFGSQLLPSLQNY